jgi:hypothetical protein
VEVGIHFFSFYSLDVFIWLDFSERTWLHQCLMKKKLFIKRDPHFGKIELLCCVCYCFRRSHTYTHFFNLSHAQIILECIFTKTFDCCWLFRVHLPNNVAVGSKHCDADYNHPPGEINFWVPLTKGTTNTKKPINYNCIYRFISGHCESVEKKRWFVSFRNETNDLIWFDVVWGNNGFWVESAPNKGDFHPIGNLNYGDIFRFYGNKCQHYNNVNDTGLDRSTNWINSLQYMFQENILISLSCCKRFNADLFWFSSDTNVEVHSQWCNQCQIKNEIWDRFLLQCHDCEEITRKQKTVCLGSLLLSKKLLWWNKVLAATHDSDSCFPLVKHAYLK